MGARTFPARQDYGAVPSASGFPSFCDRWSNAGPISAVGLGSMHLASHQVTYPRCRSRMSVSASPWNWLARHRFPEAGGSLWSEATAASALATPLAKAKNTHYLLRPRGPLCNRSLRSA